MLEVGSRRQQNLTELSFLPLSGKRILFQKPQLTFSDIGQSHIKNPTLYPSLARRNGIAVADSDQSQIISWAWQRVPSSLSTLWPTLYLKTGEGRGRPQGLPQMGIAQHIWGTKGPPAVRRDGRKR